LYHSARKASELSHPLAGASSIAIPSLLGISLILFTVLALAPGDPFGELATNPNVPEQARDRDQQAAEEIGSHRGFVTPACTTRPGRPAIAPGDPFGELATNPNVPPEVREALRLKFGLDDPIWGWWPAPRTGRRARAPGR
jgi:ABC-type dipeptide/oligopeptide/nickel transport system permease component